MNLWILCLLCLLPQSAQAFRGKPTALVSVHGVNYSNEEFSYTVEDPNDARNKAGGELINRFGAGGTMCCYDLPKQWTPGLQVKVNSTHWLPEQADGKLPEVRQTFVVEVPPYADGKPGELWVLRQADGSVKVVSSDYQPDHEKWPGDVKGWPVPSAEYRRERIKIHLSVAEANAEASRDLLLELKSDPSRRMKEAWEFKRKYSPKDLEAFSGPDDPGFGNWLQTSYEANLRRSEARISELRKQLDGNSIE
jgi:hypothetical protein